MQQETLHTEIRREESGHFVSHLLNFSLCIMDLFLYALYYRGALPIEKILLVHFSLVFCFLIFLSLIPKTDSRARFLAISIILLSFLGPFGAGMMVMIYLLYPLYTQLVVPFNKELSAFFREEMMPSVVWRNYEKIYHRKEEYDDTATPVPFINIMSFGTYRQKRLVIQKALRFFRPQFSEVFYQGLNDPDNAVRVLSATAIRAIDDQYYKIYIELEKDFNKNPDDIERILNFAEHCVRYVQLKTIDIDRREKLIEKGIESFHIALRLDPDHSEAKLSLAKLLLMLAQASHRYCSIFEQSVALDWSKDSEEKVCKPCQGGLFEQDDVTDAQICPVSYEKPGPARASHRVSSEGGQDVESDLLSIDREHCPSDKARAIEGKDDVTDCPDLPRACEKPGLSNANRAVELIMETMNQKGKLSIDAIHDLMESLYLLKRYNDLRHLSTQVKIDEKKSGYERDTINELLDLWASPDFS